ncbi:MAG: RES family NAD+ phosphorylase [Flavobacteriales bacterium]|nr:RES family NAD+ phosphorylase [Flavobacteriales bacterium]
MRACPQCASFKGKKLTQDLGIALVHRFFVRGSIQRTRYGGYPAIQFNDRHEPSVKGPLWLDADIRLLERTLGIGLFHYGPRYWMFGEIEPLKALQRLRERARIVQRVVKEYPRVDLTTSEMVFRVRKNVPTPDDPAEYDSAPREYNGTGRLDSKGHPVLYASKDMELCLHECRVAAEDELFVASLQPSRTLHLLDLTTLLIEENVSEFESLDLAIHMLFLAGEHSYPVTRWIARAAKGAGFDGLAFPSYFSILRTGAIPFETVYGISHRLIPQMHENERAKIVPNIALFGKPVAQGLVEVKSINRVVLRTVRYGAQLGPVGLKPK